MNLRIYDPRILAIEVRHRRLGFAVFEGHRHLLGWGRRVYRETGDLEATTARKRLNVLFDIYAPSSLVVIKERWLEPSPRLRTVIEALFQEAVSQSIPICAVDHNDLRLSLGKLGSYTRYETANALGRIFPELAQDVPPPRRTWQAEHPRMIVFDAVALGLAYWQSEYSSIYLPDTDDL